MNDKLIKQIKELNGVETVETFSDKSDKVVVTFEAEKVAVECTNSEQCKFIHIQNSWEHNPIHNSIDGSIFLRLTHMGWDSRREYCNKDGNTIISFTQYLKEYNLQDEWGKYLIGECEKRYPYGTKVNSLGGNRGAKITSTIFRARDCAKWVIENHGDCSVYDNGQWAEIIPDELDLVKGEIYYHDTETQPNIFRFKSVTKNGSFMTYSTMFIGGCIFINVSSVLKGRNPKPATDKQKRKLIKQEIKNGYFHELNK